MYRCAWLLLVLACGSARVPAIHEEPVVVVATAPDAAVASDAPVAIDAALDAPVAVAPQFASAAIDVEVRGAGRPIILIPGLGCPPSVWNATVAHLSKTAETHVVAIAGFAGKPAIAEPINATVRSELARYIRERGLDHPVVIGHSLGGFIAFWLAASEPSLVGPTIIVDQAPQTFGDTQLATIEARANRWRKMTTAQFGMAIADYYGTMARNRTLLDPLIAEVARSDRRVFADALVELGAVDLRPSLSAIRAPILQIVADGQTFAATVTQQMTPIPDRRQVMLRGTRHFVFFDDPVGFFREVDEFLDAHPR